MLQRSSDQLEDGLNEQAGSAVERSSQPTVDLRELARILRRRWKLVTAVPAILLAIALIYVVLATTLYTATSTVLVDPRRSTAIESNQAAMQMSNFGTDDATIDEYWKAFSDDARRRGQLELYRSGDFEKLEPYVRDMKMNYPVLQGLGHDDVQDAYGPILGIPVSVLISRDGN